MVQNGKFDETGLARRFEERQAKHTSLLGSEHQRAVYRISSQRPLLAGEHQSAVNHIGSQRPLLAGGTAGHIYGYSVPPSVLPGSVAGPIPETVHGSLAASRGDMVMGGVSSGITKGTNNALHAGSYGGFRGRMPIEDKAGQIRSYNNQLYGWKRSASMHERAVSHNYGYWSSPSWQGSMGLRNPVPVGPGDHTTASDSYQLASTVPGSGTYQNSGSHAVHNQLEIDQKDLSSLRSQSIHHHVSLVPSVKHHSSYLYPGTYYPQGMQ